MKQSLSLIASLSIFLTIISCATNGNDFSQTYLKDITDINVTAAPDFNTRNDQTFTIISASNIFKEIKMNEIEEQYIMLFLRSIMELKGYKYVSADKNPDLILSINASNEYSEYYVPPSTISLPKFEPGTTLTTYGNFNSYGSYGMNSFSATTRTSGKWTSENITIGGYQVGNYYPCTAISVFDAKTQKNIWNGSAVGTSDVQDVRVSNQVVIASILYKFPDCKNRDFREEIYGRGGIGLDFTIWTLDGNNYFPVVIEMDKSAQQAGILINDIILSIDGVSVVNKPVSEVWNLIKGEPGTKVNLDMFSRGKRHSIDVIRVGSVMEGNLYFKGENFSMWENQDYQAFIHAQTKYDTLLLIF